MLETRGTLGRQDLKYYSTRSRYSVVTLEVGMPGTDFLATIGKSKFLIIISPVGWI
jgi:hypothetical protein